MVGEVIGSSMAGTKAQATNSNEQLHRGSSFADSPDQPNLQLKLPVLDTILARRNQARQGKPALYARLSSLGVTHEDFVSAIERSKQSGASAIQELISNNVLHADEYYRKLAQEMDVTFVTFINPSTILLDMNTELVDYGSVFQLFGRSGSGLTLLYIAPDSIAESSLSTLLESDPEQKKRIRICTPKTISVALETKKSAANLEWATSDLHRKHPDLSAKQVFAPWQAYLIGVFCTALPVFFYNHFLLSSFVTHIAASMLFAKVIMIRIAVFRKLKKRKPPPDALPVSYFPLYSVLIALHKEAAVAHQLIGAMSRLDWPASRLEVLYVCEADDAGTIDALVSIGLPIHHRIIKVPPGLPRTKPKALNFALKACAGEFIVIYDAEDRPHPQQLKEAWSVFSKADASLACLQAPLTVTNAASSWMARMFAFEYAAHFIGLLPFLAETSVPLPLGGTSNHFRKSALEVVGGWDPHNVTEDADLGIRFYRFGYKCGVLHLPTLEDGPETLKEWYPQRTRWQKGWMQTFLVQNRNINQLFDRLGRRNAHYFEALLAGFILSPLLYFISILLAAYSIYSLEPTLMAITAMDLLLLLMGYFCAIAIGFECIKKWSRWEKMIVAVTLPLYWILLSAAAWRAVYQLVVKPHHWEKTPHRPTTQHQVFGDDQRLETIGLPVSNPVR